MTENVAETSENGLVYLPAHDRYHDDEIHGILSSVNTIAMVGASALWRRPSYYAMNYLQKKGFRVIPINPTRVGELILGETVYASLSDCPAPVDMPLPKMPLPTRTGWAFACSGCNWLSATTARRNSLRPLNSPSL